MTLHMHTLNDSVLHDWYVQAEVISADIDVMPDVPRTVSRQLSRDNIEHASPEKYYRRSIALPLLDHSIQQMKERFWCFHLSSFT